jgi:hypothetical protein
MNNLIHKDIIQNICWYVDFDNTLLRNSAVGYFTLTPICGEVSPWRVHEIKSRGLFKELVILPLQSQYILL